MERRFVYDWATTGQNYITTKCALNTNMGRFLKLVNVTSGLRALQPLNFYPRKSDFVQDGTEIDWSCLGSGWLAIRLSGWLISATISQGVQPRI